MRISDWSSDVCSSDLPCQFQNGRWSRPRVKAEQHIETGVRRFHFGKELFELAVCPVPRFALANLGKPHFRLRGDRKCVVSGKRVSVRLDLGGRWCINIKILTDTR